MKGTTVNTTTNATTQLAIEIAGEFNPEAAREMLICTRRELQSELSRLTGKKVKLAPPIEHAVRALLLAAASR